MAAKGRMDDGVREEGWEAGVPAVILAASATVASTSCGTSEASIQRGLERQRRRKGGGGVWGQAGGGMHHRVPA